MQILSFKIKISRSLRVVILAIFAYTVYVSFAHYYLFRPSILFHTYIKLLVKDWGSAINPPVSDQVAVLVDQNNQLKHKLNVLDKLYQQARSDLQAKKRAMTKHSLYSVKPFEITLANAKHYFTFVRDCKTVKSGQFVFDHDALLGRVNSCNAHVAVVQLVTDYQSALPVTVSHTHINGVLVGQGNADLSLMYVPEGSPISVGDEVLLNHPSKPWYASMKLGIVSKVQSSIKRDYLVIKVKPYYVLEHGKWYAISSS
ncbi:MAG: rod shape-determining protein MreC [Pseudomonadota bacterium]|nr:rod shape-determining protein MreC [Pseudomonadota bacterium]